MMCTAHFDTEPIATSNDRTRVALDLIMMEFEESFVTLLFYWIN